MCFNRDYPTLPSRAESPPRRIYRCETSWTWGRKWWNHSWHSSWVTLNHRYFAIIRPRTPLVYRYHVISRTQSHSAVFGCSPIGVDGVAPTAGPCLTVEQLLFWSDIWTGRAAQIDAKTKFRFGNIVQKQLTLLGFVQHTSASSMYKDNDNKIQISVRHYPLINCLFSEFWNINGEHESTLTTSKKYSWCIPEQKEIKPIIWWAAITPEPWNRQQC